MATAQTAAVSAVSTCESSRQCCQYSGLAAEVGAVITAGAAICTIA